MAEDTCTAVYVLWEAEGDSIEVSCTLKGEHPQHEGEIEGSAAFTDQDLVIEMKAKVCWPIRVKVEAT